MATHHAEPGEVVNLSTWSEDLPREHSKAIVKHAGLELARITLGRGETWEEHRVEGPVVIHCLSGRVCCRIPAGERLLTGGQLLYLHGESHALRAEEDTVMLLTIVLAGSTC